MNEETLKFVRGVELSDRLAWNLKDGAAIIGLSYESVRKEIRRRKIIPTPTYKLLTKDELTRYLREEIQIGRRRAFGVCRANVLASARN